MSPMLDDRYVTHSSVMLDDAAPARAWDVSGLPRTFIDVGSAEGFRDEALDYATRLSQAGISVDLHMWAGGFHGYENISAATISRTSYSTRAQFVRRALER